VLRILLTAEDLVRVRFEASPGPLVDVGLAARALRRPSVPSLAYWREELRLALDKRLFPLLALTPPTGTSCAFISPLCPDLPTGLELVRATPTRNVRSEVADLRTGAARGTAEWLRRLAEGDREAQAALIGATTRLHAVGVAPFEANLVNDREADVGRRAAELASHGLDATIRGLHRTVRLDGLTLQIDRSFSFTHQSDGSGVILVPAPMLVDEVRVAFGEGEPVRLFYPTGTPMAGAADATQTDHDRSEPPAADPLARVLGGTRAAVLRAIRDGCGTVALSRRIGVSPATASEHVSALRGAGLVATKRVGRGVRHWLTPLGAGLLHRSPYTAAPSTAPHLRVGHER
jgi:DNA-binding transcriptional ArsR family regulator